MTTAAKKRNYAIKIDHDLCGICGACVAVCPADALHLGTIRLEALDENCIGCRFCIITCPSDALELLDD